MTFRLIQVSKVGAVVASDFPNYMTACARFESAKKGGLAIAARLTDLKTGFVNLQWRGAGVSESYIADSIREHTHAHQI